MPKSVWIIEFGAYSDRYIDTVFTTRELAIEYLCRRLGCASEDEIARKEQANGNWGRYPLPEEFDLWDAVPHAEAKTDA